MNTQTVQTVPPSDVTNVGTNTDALNTYDVIVKVDKFSDCVRSAGLGYKDVYSNPVYIRQWNSWVRGMVQIRLGGGEVNIYLLHHTHTDVDWGHTSPQHQQLSLQTSVTSSTTLEVMQVVEEETRGSHLAGIVAWYWVGGQYHHPAQKGWVVGDRFTVKISLTL